MCMYFLTCHRWYWNWNLFETIQTRLDLSCCEIFQSSLNLCFNILCHDKNVYKTLFCISVSITIQLSLVTSWLIVVSCQTVTINNHRNIRVPTCHGYLSLPNSKFGHEKPGRGEWENWINSQAFLRSCNQFLKSLDSNKIRSIQVTWQQEKIPTRKHNKFIFKCFSWIMRQ